MCLLSRMKCRQVSTNSLNACKRNIVGLDKVDLELYVSEKGWDRFRADQIRNWILARGAQTFDSMNNIPYQIKAALESDFSLGELEIAKEAKSKDGTLKRLYRLRDGNP